MRDTIAKLWNGNLDPIRYLGVNNSEIKQLETLIQKNCKKLEEKLDEKAKDIFERYRDCLNEYIVVIVEEAFCDGFCLGTKITVESLTKAE